jgi:hypothetical protein
MPPPPPPPQADSASIIAQADEARNRLFIAYSPASRWNLTTFPGGYRPRKLSFC